VEDLTYLDTNVDDGVYYSYKITAANGEESDYSPVVRQMHGTRLLASYQGWCTLEAGALNPFVVEDSVKIIDGDLEIEAGASLYVLDGAVVDAWTDTEGSNITTHVMGLLRVVASPSDPAALTAHAIVGDIPDGRGQLFRFYDEAIDYNPADGSGCLIQNCTIDNLAQGDGAIRLNACSPRFYNCKIASNKATGGSYLSIYSGSAPIIEHCSITRVTLSISTDLSGTDALIYKNVCRDSYYTLWLGPGGPGLIDPGQVAQNDLDGDVHGLYMFQVEAGDIPLANNYWYGGLPDIVGGAGTPVFEPVLDSPPADCGPTW
jgi:hypothetical protein